MGVYANTSAIVDGPTSYIDAADVSTPIEQLDAEIVKIRWGKLFPSITSVTLASDAFTVGTTSGAYAVAPQTGSDDNLATISGAQAGQLIVLTTTSTNVITVKHNTGNIKLNGATDFYLTANKSLALIYDGTSFHDLGAGTPDADLGVCEGRLTASSTDPVAAATGTTLYYLPYLGNRITLYDGVNWLEYTFSAINITNGGLSANTNYDVYVYLNAGTPALELEAWSNSGAGTSARAATIGQVAGVYIKSGDATRRYVGTIRTNASTQFTVSGTEQFIWNAYNRVPRILVVTETTDTWASGTNNVWRQVRATAANKVGILVGLNNHTVRAHAKLIANAAAATVFATGIGYDTTTANIAQARGCSTAASASIMVADTCAAYLNNQAGYHELNWLDIAAGAVTFVGDNGGTIMQSAMTAEIEC